MFQGMQRMCQGGVDLGLGLPGINFLISGDGQPLNWRKCSPSWTGSVLNHCSTEDAQHHCRRDENCTTDLVSQKSRSLICLQFHHEAAFCRISGELHKLLGCHCMIKEFWPSTTTSSTRGRMCHNMPMWRVTSNNTYILCMNHTITYISYIKFVTYGPNKSHAARHMGSCYSVQASHLKLRLQPTFYCRTLNCEELCQILLCCRKTR